MPNKTYSLCLLLRQLLKRQIKPYLLANLLVFQCHLSNIKKNIVIYNKNVYIIIPCF